MLGAGSPPASFTCGAECTLAGTPGCDGVVGSGLLEDQCGVCAGNGSSCTAPAVPAEFARTTCQAPAMAPRAAGLGTTDGMKAAAGNRPVAGAAVLVALLVVVGSGA